MAPEGALVSVKVQEPPTLDGAADDAAWQNAAEITVAVTGGANNASTEVVLKSVYTADMVYFLATWADPTESWLRAPWEKQPDSTWKKLGDPNDKGGDNNLYYEDKLAFIWSINNSIVNFDKQGCFTACHAGENPDLKPYGNKYTAGEGQWGDIWHWKSIRNLNQVDDQYLDWTQYSADTPEAGRKSDAKESGGYANNETEDKTLPAFMPPDGGSKDGSPVTSWTARRCRSMTASSRRAIASLGSSSLKRWAIVAIYPPDGNGPMESGLWSLDASWTPARRPTFNSSI